MRWLRAGLLVAMTVAWMPAVAHGQAFTPCEPAGTLCATVQVPLDRTGAVPGSVNLAVRRQPAKSGASSGALVYLTGGPGDPVLDRMATLGRRIEAALATRDLIAFDYRGLGLSSPISCRLRSGAEARADLTACGQSLGPARGFYTTRDSADDVEAVRRAVGVDRIAIYSISYGAVAAYDYVSRYPEHVEWVVFDSPVPPGGFDSLLRSAVGAVARILRSVCSYGCRGATRDPVGNLAKLAAEVRRKKGLRGRLVGDNGKVGSGTLTPADLWTIVHESDLNALVRLQLPAAYASAVRGDPAPLLRVAREVLRALERITPTGQDAGSFSRTINRATLCEDGTFPWARDSAPEIESRAAAIDAALAGIPASDFAPFNKLDPIGGVSPLNSCLTWPHSTRLPQLDSAPAPDVPALILAGEHDVRTPQSDAQALARRFPRGQLVLSPATGHGVLASAPASVSACVNGAFQRFVTGQPAAGPCPRATLRFAVPQLAPRSLADVAPIRGLRGTPGRVLAAVVSTLEDAQFSYAATYNAVGKAAPVGGLRAGRMSGPLDRVKLAGLSYVPGVKLTGNFDLNKATASVRVSATARGTVRLTKSGLTGKLGGRRFSLKRPARPVPLAG